MQKFWRGTFWRGKVFPGRWQGAMGVIFGRLWAFAAHFGPTQRALPRSEQ